MSRVVVGLVSSFLFCCLSADIMKQKKTAKDNTTSPVPSVEAPWLSPVRPAVDTNWTTGADVGVFVYSAVPTRAGPVLNTPGPLGSTPPEPRLARPRSCCTTVLSF